MDGAVMNAKRLVGASIGTLAFFGAAIALASGVGAQAVDQRVADCGLSTPGNALLATFELDRASDFWKRFPAAGGAPELENDRPALAVVFAGGYTWFRTGEKFQNVVCVFQDEYPYIYPNVDLTGADLAE